jgi:hypothetical protein
MAIRFLCMVGIDEIDGIDGIDGIDEIEGLRTSGE